MKSALFTATLFCLLFALSAAAQQGCGTTVIAIDAGHSPESPGATSARGKPEHAFNDRLAGLLLERLHAAGFTRAFIVPVKAGGLSPSGRAGAANDARADLLISVHHDSVQPAYLSEWSYDGRTLLYCDKFDGYSLFISGPEDTGNRALLFARILAARLISAGLRPSHHHAEAIPGEARHAVDAEKGIYRDDNLEILKRARVPAILVEAGVIVNRDEEAMLETPAYRERIAEAVVSSAGEYCSALQK